MSVRSYTKVWLHFIWGTKNRESLIVPKEFRKELSDFYYEYSKSKDIFMRFNFVNKDHVHALIDMPTERTIQELAQLLKGASSRWINTKVDFQFSWAKGYAGFSVSESVLSRVIKYLQNQETHHKYKSFTEEYEEFLLKYKIMKNG